MFDKAQAEYESKDRPYEPEEEEREKVHVCDECGCAIYLGDEYILITSGEYKGSHLCIDCNDGSYKCVHKIAGWKRNETI